MSEELFQALCAVEDVHRASLAAMKTYQEQAEKEESDA